MRVHIRAEVDQTEPGALEHHCDEILADVVEITLHRTQYHRAQRLGARFHQLGTNDIQARLHRLRRHQHLGHEQDTGAELPTHLVQGGDHAVVEDGVDVSAGCNLGRHQLSNALLVVPHDRIIDSKHGHWPLLFPATD